MVASGFGARRSGNDEDVVEKAGRADPLDAVKMFVEAGANVNAVNDTASTALHYAALTGSTRIVEFLVSKGAALDAKNKLGKTPLDLANTKGPTAALLRRLTGAPAN